MNFQKWEYCFWLNRSSNDKELVILRNTVDIADKNVAKTRQIDDVLQDRNRTTISEATGT